MAEAIRELEGTWEEIAAHAPYLAGRRVRLTLLDLEAERRVTGPKRPEPTPEQAALGILPAANGLDKILDFDTWYAALPKIDLTDEEYEEFVGAIAEDRALRRRLAAEGKE